MEDNKRTKVKIDKYYDLEGFMNQQLAFLISKAPKVEKTVIVDGKEESKSLKYDSIDWQKDLHLFLQADINMPNLRDSYYEQAIEKNGVKRLIYTLKDTEEGGIVRLEILKDADENVSQINAHYLEENILYFSTRDMNMNFRQINNNVVLSEYKIDGVQKVIFNDTTKYYIKSNISYE